MENKPRILYGKPVAEDIYSKLPDMKGKTLAIITIGDDDASKVYVRKKTEACERVGLQGINYRFYPEHYKSPEDLGKHIVDTILDLNRDKNVVGIMVQRPYPIELDDFFLEEQIFPYKDVDGLNTKNMVSTLLGKHPCHYPATPDGIMMMLDYYNIPVEGKNVVIINRSEIVGLPLEGMMRARNATVTVCHSKTPKIKLMEHTRAADIIISAVGNPKFLTSDYITTTYPDHDGHPHKMSLKFPTVIDVAMCRDENGKLCGDCDFEDMLPYVGDITPVPGGVGIMTVCALVKHCCKYLQNNRK